MCNKTYALGTRLRVNCEGGELERGWLQEPVRRSVRGTPETDVFRQHTVGPLRQRQVILRRDHRRYIQQAPNFSDKYIIYTYTAKLYEQPARFRLHTHAYTRACRDACTYLHAHTYT